MTTIKGMTAKKLAEAAEPMFQNAMASAEPKGGYRDQIAGGLYTLSLAVEALATDLEELRKEMRSNGDAESE